MGRPKLELTGQKFSRLTVIKDSGKRSYKHIIWQCKCDCGNFCLVRRDHLQANETKSCGCLNKEIARKGGKLNKGKKHTKETKQKMSKTRIKENNPNWQGGVTSKRILIRNSDKYKTWRKAVFEIDNYTCQKCNQKGGTLNAHHIEAFNNNPDLRTEIDNGITLCEDCHKNFHHQYGYNCTKEQFKEFMENK